MSEGKVLSRNDVMTADDLPRERVEVPEWGGAVDMRTLTSAERDAFEVRMLRDSDDDPESRLENLRARLVAACAVDEDGHCLFSEDDVEALGGKSARAMDRLFDVAQRMNGMGPDAIEDLTKN